MELGAHAAMQTGGKKGSLVMGSLVNGLTRRPIFKLRARQTSCMAPCKCKEAQQPVSLA